ncbi:hypothetical protein ARMSODRAFT_978412 [Armillaria solidipes]|uniref:Uncharacterized protein n=1 Tax=Armillaria solidipes TaxID=1076256 RepID=A0A2H3BGZ1_9AGAR|nr:hypothetical protein ARMSODRAFT_978412 [Armillaria solidipes]
MAPCPSVAELINGVKSLMRQNQGTFQTAWSDSFTSPSHCCEQGSFIYVDFPVPNRVTRAWITWAPKGATMNQRTPGPNASIDLNRPGIQMNNVILGIVVSRDGIYSYGPERRANTKNSKGYPGPVSPPAVAQLTGAKRQLPALCEGAPGAVDGTLVENEATADASSAGDPDVIYVEWFDEDVVYDEPLAESEDSIEIRSEADE